MRSLRSLRPVHALVMLVAAFVAGQALGGLLATIGLAVSVSAGELHWSVLDDPEGLVDLMASPFVLLPSAVGSSIALAAVAVGAALLARVPLREALALRHAPLGAWVLGPVGALGCALVADQLVFHFGRLLPDLTLGALPAFGEAARVRTPLAGTVVLFAMAGFPGCCEEIFFRGAFQGALASRWGTWPTVVVSALAFGIIHIDPPQALGAAVLGGYLGWLTARTRSVGPAIAAHVSNNAAAFVSANVPALTGMGYGSPNPVPWSLVAVGAVLLAICVSVIALVTRSAPPADSPAIS